MAEMPDAFRRRLLARMAEVEEAMAAELRRRGYTVTPPDAAFEQAVDAFLRGPTPAEVEAEGRRRVREGLTESGRFDYGGPAWPPTAGGSSDG